MPPDERSESRCDWCGDADCRNSGTGNSGVGEDKRQDMNKAEIIAQTLKVMKVTSDNHEKDQFLVSLLQDVTFVI